MDITYILHANRALADEARKRDARAAFAAEGSVRASLGVEHVTAADLAASLWELWGDGRAIAGDMQRLLAVYGLLGACGLQASVGTARQVASFLKRHLAAVQDAGFEAPGLTRAERSVCTLARDYCRLLDDEGLVELSQALRVLAPHARGLDVRAAGPLLLDEPLASFLEGLLGPGFDASVPAAGDGAPDFALLRPEGATAVEGMVLDEVLASASERGLSSFAIVAPRPLEAYAALAAPLRRAGIACALEAVVPLSRTSFGRFFLSACKLLALAGLYGVDGAMEPADDAWVDVATDVALSPYAGIAPFDAAALPSSRGRQAKATLHAEDLNTFWRADRLLCAEDAACDLAAVSAGFQALQVLFTLEGDPFAVVERFRADARRLFSGAQAAAEESAAAALKDLIGAAAEQRCPAPYVALFAGCVSVQASVADEAAKAEGPAHATPPLALFASFDGAARMAFASFDEVVLCDVSDAHLNAREEAAATDALAAKFGRSRRTGRMERSRLAFSSAARAARSRFACVFATRDAASEESFTSFAFDEFVEARFHGALSVTQAVDGVAPGELEELPPDAARFADTGMRRKGEEDVVSGVGRILLEPAGALSLRRPERGRLARLQLASFLRSVRLDGGASPCLSVSAIESYLGCPYRWFLERVVNPRTLDEGFGPLQAGNFAHALLEAFYEGLEQRTGSTRMRDVEPGVMSEVFGDAARRVFDQQFGMPPNEGRYVPATNVEALAVRRLVDEAWRSVLLQRALPKAYRVAATEYALGGEAGPRVAYAGFALDGKVDRVDADAGGGSFVVVDYKGSVSGHAAGDASVSILCGEGGARIDPASLPRHVQALVYAQALRRAGSFGDACRGALYTSYRADSPQRLVTGSYAADEHGLAALSDPSSCVFGDFDAFLDMVEEAVAERLEGVASSRIPAEASFDEACRHCSNAFCERRSACR